MPKKLPCLSTSLYMLTMGSIGAVSIGAITFAVLRSDHLNDNCDYLNNHISEFNGCNLQSAAESNFNCYNLTERYHNEPDGKWMYPHGLIDVVCNNVSTSVQQVYAAALAFSQNSLQNSGALNYPLTVIPAFLIGSLYGRHLSKA